MNDKQQGILLVEEEAGPTLVTNLDSSITVYLHTGHGFASSDQSGLFPLAPGSTVVIDNDVPTYGTCQPGLSANVGIIPGGVHFFAPTSRITIPTGATTGRRIVIDGTAGTITMYSTANNVTGVWSASGQSFTLYKDGNLHSYMVLQNSGSFGPEIHFNADSTLFTDSVLSGSLSSAGGLETMSLAMLSGASIGHGAQFAQIIASSGTQDGTSVAQGQPIASYGGPGLDSPLGNIVVDSPWTNLTLNTGFQTFGTVTPAYNVMSNGLVQLRGQIQPNPAGALPNSSTPFFLPLNPKGIARFTCPTSSHTSGNTLRLDFATNGNATITFNQTGFAPTFFSIDGIIYSIV